jgi:hypothetical protein
MHAEMPRLLGGGHADGEQLGVARGAWNPSFVLIAARGEFPLGIALGGAAPMLEANLCEQLLVLREAPAQLA